jgi:hypothetical protein
MIVSDLDVHGMAGLVRVVEGHRVATLTERA